MRVIVRWVLKRSYLTAAEIQWDILQTGITGQAK